MRDRVSGVGQDGSDVGLCQSRVSIQQVGFSGSLTQFAEDEFNGNACSRESLVSQA